MKILIAEDNRLIHQFYKAFVLQRGYDYLLVENGLAAVECVRQAGHGLDMAILDIEMPVMNGLEAIKAIRAVDRRMPILACSSHSSYQAAGLLAGADTFLRKPFDGECLQGQIERLLPGAANHLIGKPAVIY